jgi:N-acetylmuramoyl-L-alanine amidase
MKFNKMYHKSIIIITTLINCLLFPIDENIYLKYLPDGRYKIVCKIKGIINVAYYLPTSRNIYFNDKIIKAEADEPVDNIVYRICKQIEETENKSSLTSAFSTKESEKTFLTRKRYKIVLDPGHGGKFNGTTGAYFVEKDLNLDIATRLYNLLKDKYEVVLTRNKDTELNDSLEDDLNARVNIAHRIGADLFISIHHNFAFNSSIRGFEIYVPTQENWQTKCEQISSLSFVGGKKSSEQYCNYLKYATNTIAGVIAKKISNVLPFNGIRTKNLRVLRENFIPSVLLEIEYLSNPDAESFLMNEYNRQKIVKVIAEAVDEYFQNYQPK